MKPSSFVSALVAAGSLVACLSAHAAGPVSTVVLGNAQIASGGCSSIMAVATTDPTFTVYFKPLTMVTTTAYNARLESSPDGVNWSQVSGGNPDIAVAKNAPLNQTYSATVAVKAARLRLCVFSDTSTSFTTTASAWIVN